MRVTEHRKRPSAQLLMAVCIGLISAMSFAPLGFAQEGGDESVSAENQAGGGEPTPEAASTGDSNKPQQNKLPDGKPEEVLFNILKERSRAMAKKSFSPPGNRAPEVLRNLSFEQYQDIRFRPEAALWRGESLFEIQLFHPGFLYNRPVNVHVVTPDSLLSDVSFNGDLFNYGDSVRSLPQELSDGLSFAGLRVHYPINNNHYKDEVVVFQGASYFRLVGPGQTFGLSARGLAINTGEAGGEEFPIFTDFWLIKPDPNASSLYILAMLDSPSVVGAYQFKVDASLSLGMEVKSYLVARQDINKLGMAPLTSMFFHGENSSRFFDDYRPEVHDSDGLQMRTNADEWIWRALTNPASLQITSSVMENPRGFGLLQRDRDFDSFLDLGARYEKRPSFWVEPLGDWGKGRVELVEIPTASETNDNVVAYWVPEAPLQKGQDRSFAYRIRSVDGDVIPGEVAKVIRTRVGRSAVAGQRNPPPESQRRITIDFKADALGDVASDVPVQASLSVSRGQASDVRVTQLPDGDVWRASFILTPESDQPVDMRLYLTLRNQRLSEVWNYVWNPNTIQ